MTTTVETTGLTREDLRALKQADSIVFQDNERTGPMIRAIRKFRQDEDIRATDRALFPVTDNLMWDERERHLSVNGEVYTFVEHASKRFGGTAFAMFHSSKYSARWRTVMAFLKVEDVLTLEFGGDRFSSENSRKTGMHLDGFSLRVMRKSKNGGHDHFEFLLDVSLCPDNTARMVKPA